MQETLNSFMALGRPAWLEARSTLQKILSLTGPDLLRDNLALQNKAPLKLIPGFDST
jgi:fumarylacetoacetase